MQKEEKFANQQLLLRVFEDLFGRLAVDHVLLGRGRLTKEDRQKARPQQESCKPDLSEVGGYLFCGHSSPAIHSVWRTCPYHHV